MRVSREKAAENRERILDAASGLFRAKGFGGIGVADIMKAADLTHGGFYGHFASKDDLVAEASRRSMERAAVNWSRVVAGATASPTPLCSSTTCRQTIATNRAAVARLQPSVVMRRGAATQFAELSPKGYGRSSIFSPNRFLAPRSQRDGARPSPPWPNWSAR